jgi:hypothetical protein
LKEALLFYPQITQIFADEPVEKLGHREALN